MAIRFFIQDDDTGNVVDTVDFRVGNLHSLIVEQPPALALRQFFSWNQAGVSEIFGGQQGRAFYVECWVHDPDFEKVQDVDVYTKYLDLIAGKHGRFELAPDDSFDSEFGLIRNDTTFLGFHRKPFDGQRLPEPLRAIGTHDDDYGDFHICGELHFFQLKLNGTV